jgi:hypothetical protein
VPQAFPSSWKACTEVFGALSAESRRLPFRAECTVARVKPGRKVGEKRNYSIGVTTLCLKTLQNARNTNRRRDVPAPKFEIARCEVPFCIGAPLHGAECETKHENLPWKIPWEIIVARSVFSAPSRRRNENIRTNTVKYGQTRWCPSKPLLIPDFASPCPWAELTYWLPLWGAHILLPFVGRSHID